MGTQLQKFDAVVAAAASRRHGIVTHAQLRALGFSNRVIQSRVASGYLIPLHRGVYVVGHLAVAPLARQAAAVLACAPRALVAGASATAMWKLPVSEPSAVQILVVGRSIRPQNGLRARTISHLHPSELRRIEGIPVASPALALLDLAGSEPEATFRKAHREARLPPPLVTPFELSATVTRHPTRAGAALINSTLASEMSRFASESEAEDLCLRLMLKHGIKPDATQERIGSYRVDFLFRAEKVVVEVDGYRFHSSHERFVADRRRTAALLELGYQVFPITWADLTEAPDETMRRLNSVLLSRRLASDERDP